MAPVCQRDVSGKGEYKEQQNEIIFETNKFWSSYVVKLDSDHVQTWFSASI